MTVSPHQQPDINTSESYVFISYARENKQIARRIVEDLKEQGYRVWIDLLGLEPSDDWESELRRAIEGSMCLLLLASSDSRRSPYVRDEIAIAQMNHRPVVFLWIVGEDGHWHDAVPMGMGVRQYIDMRETAYEAGLAQLTEKIDMLSTADASSMSHVSIPDTKQVSDCTDDAPRHNPYMGLRAFTENDRDYFFGRQLLIADLIDRLHFAEDTPRLLMLMGASGSGKSSVMRAGLLPALRAGGVEDSQSWIYPDPVTPREDPFEQLTVVLSSHIPTIPFDVLKQNLQSASTRGLHRTAMQILADTPDARLVIYLDQFEQVFTRIPDKETQNHFLDTLITAATEPDGQVIVLTSCRADFYDRTLQHPRLGTLMQDCTHNITPMSLADLYDVVQGPASRPEICVTFDDYLVSDMVHAVHHQPGGLPLLQFTLYRLFEQREGRQLTRASYEAFGGLEGAISSHAEATYQALPSDSYREMARVLFLRLIIPQDGALTRRRIPLGSLSFADEDATEQLQTVIERFVAARLLVITEEMLDITHEILISQWERLATWVQKAEDDLRYYDRFRDDVIIWVQKGRSIDYAGLYMDELLTEAQNWAERHLLNDDEQAFLSASITRQKELDKREREREAALITAKERAKDAQLREGEARQSATYNRRRVLLISVASVLIVVGLVGLGINMASTQNTAAEFGDTLIQGLGVNPVADIAASDVVATVTAIETVVSQPVQEDSIDGVPMVFVPGGCFWRGHTENYWRDVKAVCVEDFWIDKYEVSNAQFARFGGEMPSTPNCISQEEEDAPRNCVLWNEAYTYCSQQRSGFLPDADQWEYAARGPYSLQYPWGNTFDTERVINEDDARLSSLQADADINGASWVGAYHMSGNLAEWVDDEIDGYPYMGGSFDDESPELLRASQYAVYEEIDDAPRFLYSNIGFRCAITRPDSE
jgi:formylglycine-generating enzyme required for sulfatase activity